MKIKDVCAKTGLTDRTVRYYIEENLLSPRFAENHAGRRSFDFSESDVSRLGEIAVLRKFGFSVSEISEMLQNPEKIKIIISDLITRKEKDIEKQKELLYALSSLTDEDSSTMQKLADALKSPVKDLPAPKDSQKWSFFTVNMFNKKRLIVLTDAIECMLIKDRLKRAGIPYYFKTTTSIGFWGNTASIGASMRGYSAGVSHADMSGKNFYVYYFFVSRKNYEKAKKVIKHK